MAGPARSFLIAGVVAAFGLVAVPAAAPAQDKAETLADIRQELTVLNVEVQRLKRELSTSGAPSLNIEGSGVLDRVASMESELRRLTSLTEKLQMRIQSVVKDGTNRIGDLEFRLVELEGGDVSKLAETSTLGGDSGDDLPAVAAPAPSDGSGSGSDLPEGDELAVSEEADFRTAEEAMQAGDHEKAADLLAKFNETYPGSPLAARANMLRGKALAQLGDTRETARAYLAAFTADSDGPLAAEALVELGAALGELGQQSQACVTLGEVESRFPDSSQVSRAREERTRLGCS